MSYPGGYRSLRQYLLESDSEDFRPAASSFYSATLITIRVLFLQENPWKRRYRKTFLLS
ncbi:hypothetical protein M117_4896 [Bacteroides fragilis str. 3774 T13]|nr:hypothetical protein M117_4896 [Bacteroides fragilis str. 3774 T13]